MIGALMSLVAAAIAWVAPTAVPAAAGGEALTARPTIVQQAEHWTTDPGCDAWCANRHQALAAADRGDMRLVIVHSFAAYGLAVDWSRWGEATASCESGLNPAATDGYYRGLFQHDPGYWPGRAAAAGIPGGTAWDPVDNAMVTAWMVASGYDPLTQWPLCGRTSPLPA